MWHWLKAAGHSSVDPAKELGTLEDTLASSDFPQLSSEVD